MDDARWPLVVITWRGTADDEDITNFLGRMDAWLGRGEPFALLIDASGAGGLSPDQRRGVVLHMQANKARTAELLVQAMVYDNAIIRAFHLAVSLIVRPPFPNRAFGDVDEASAWLRDELARKIARGSH